ncbi:hypothetical protein RRG08_019191 [Elysia crispata]|uniref:Uncharacterized protein n=1 Tax=Elysia crispata TaxID=231223 RepID=A0AAE0ZNZ3_9GAST|nr:hypothetical protein RRG08_019191 [Elysia crispata]
MSQYVSYPPSTRLLTRLRQRNRPLNSCLFLACLTLTETDIYSLNNPINFFCLTYPRQNTSTAPHSGVSPYCYHVSSQMALPHTHTAASGASLVLALAI